MKRHDLNMAWLVKWNKLKDIKPIANDNIINLNWLSVDRATTFLMSWDNKATQEDLHKEIIDSTSKIVQTTSLHQLLIWNNKITPAVTNVEEWTSLETGVGAAIASGNQDI